MSLEDRTRLLTDKGSGYVSRAFRLVGMRHILTSPFHPRTNGKLESYYQTLKRKVSQIPYEAPSQLELAKPSSSTTTTLAATRSFWAM